MKLATGAVCTLFLTTIGASADCPSGTWPGSLYAGPGGGLYEGPGGGLYAGPGEYCSNRPPLPVFVEILDELGYEYEAALIALSPQFPSN
jgi:hypothetical protein